MDRKFILTGLGYAIVGMLLGIYMAHSKNYSQGIAHAHILLIGFMVSFVYGVCHRLWLHNVSASLAKAQYYLHQVGTFVLLLSLFLMFGGFVSEQVLGPILGLSSATVLVAMILMKVMFIKAKAV